MSKKYSIAAAALMFGTLIGVPALADDGAPASMFNTLDTVASDEMDATRGMALPFDWNEHIPEQALNNNNAVVVLGDLTITNTIDASFNGASGIATIIQNAGNNVIIQTSTMVTVNYN